MKITKEKVIYFLSLNVISWFFGFLMVLYFDFGTNNKFFIYSWKEVVTDFISIYILLFLPAILISFVYAFIKNKDYNIFHLSLIISFVPIIPLLIFISTFNSFLDFFFYAIILFSFTFVFSLIILKITDPLRRKIVW